MNQILLFNWNKFFARRKSQVYTRLDPGVGQKQGTVAKLPLQGRRSYAVLLVRGALL